MPASGGADERECWARDLTFAALKDGARLRDCGGGGVAELRKSLRGVIGRTEEVSEEVIERVRGRVRRISTVGGGEGLRDPEGRAYGWKEVCESRRSLRWRRDDKL